MTIDCANLDKNMEFCNCSYPGCVRKGKCCECIKYHLKNNELPACVFLHVYFRTMLRKRGADRSESLLKYTSDSFVGDISGIAVYT